MRVITCASALLFACTPNVDHTASSGNPDGEVVDGGVQGDTDGATTPDPDAPGSGSGSGSDDAGPSFSQGVGPYFTTPMFFNRDVSALPKSASSDTMISTLASEGGWGNNNKFQIDFSIDVVTAGANPPMRTFTTTGDFASPDCDHVPVPLPPGGNIEGNSGYACTNPGDCHLIVYDPNAGTLHEMWRADVQSSTTFYGGCLAVWNLNKAYGDTLRGDQCTSADAAGLPIAPLLINADEVASGEINHAIRFILPNNRVKRGFTRPATHGSSTTGSSSAPPYGVHLRLRADYPVNSLPTAGARTVARALQKYGMYHADGGNIALTAQSDKHTTAKWSGLLSPQDLAALKVTDFEVIDHGSMIPLTYDCNR